MFFCADPNNQRTKKTKKTKKTKHFRLWSQIAVTTPNSQRTKKTKKPNISDSGAKSLSPPQTAREPKKNKKNKQNKKTKHFRLWSQIVVTTPNSQRTKKTQKNKKENKHFRLWSQIAVTTWGPQKYYFFCFSLFFLVSGGPCHTQNISFTKQKLVLLCKT